MCASGSLALSIKRDMDEKAKEFGLLGFEVVKKIYLEARLGHRMIC